MKLINRLKLLYLLYFLLLALYSIFSYSLTAPNLVLTSWQPYWQFQTWMWETFFNDRRLLTYIFAALILTLFIVYALILKSLKKITEFITHNSNLEPRKILLTFIFLTFPLLFSNNALSYDVFNYMFNAKVVMQYGGNPHTSIPLDYGQDEWLRFMHNTHTVAPYGYGWTALSLIPYSLGLGKFLPTWVIFRLFSYLSIFLLFYALKLLAKKLSLKFELWHLALLFLNPLFLIEIISNSHNDLWMMCPAIIALALIVGKSQITGTKSQAMPKLQTSKILLSLILLVFSISIKLATTVLVPIWLLLLFQNLKLKNWNLPGICLPAGEAGNLIVGILNKNFILLSSILLFIPLLTERSKQFLPWYLIWSLVWIPVILVRQNQKLKIKNQKLLWHSKSWVYLLVIFSLTSMLRYIPNLWFGNYEGFVPVWQNMITWSAIPVWLIFKFRLKY